MKTLGIVRRVDDLGRVVIPKEVRKAAGINEGDPLEISMVQIEGKWCPLFSLYSESNPGIDLGKVEEKNVREITMRDTYNDAVYFLTLNDGAYNLLDWLADHDIINSYWEWEDGHHIETETFV